MGYVIKSAEINANIMKETEPKIYYDKRNSNINELLVLDHHFLEFRALMTYSALYQLMPNCYNVVCLIYS